jgi:hypothetical protein
VVEPYERPRLIATYSLDELRAEAGIALANYPSDQALKQEIATIEEPLRRLGKIRTR